MNDGGRGVGGRNLCVGEGGEERKLTALVALNK